VKRQHEPQRIIGDLLTAEISEKQARSIKYQMTIAKLPLAKEIKEFDFEAAEVNETLIRDLATGDFLDHQRNLVLIGGTGTGKTHLAVSIARACIRNGRRGRFFNVVDLVNKLDAEARAERQGRTADLISRLDFLILDELGYLPFAQTGGQLLFHLISKLYERTSISKYADHLPLYRLSQIFAREGVDIDRSTMADWVGRSTTLLEPLADAIGRIVRRGPALFADDTPVKMLAPGNKKTKTARVWTYVRDERPWAGQSPPCAWYQFTVDRKGEHPVSHLLGYKGWVHADG
jgi:DNA replication protein DnaC